MSSPLGNEQRLRKIGSFGWMAAAGGLALTAVGAAVDLQQFYFSYLVAWLYWLGIALGCFAIGLLHHLTGGGWGGAIRRIVDSGAFLVPIMGLAFLPLVPGMPTLYPWDRPDLVAHDPILQHKAPYLNHNFFLARTAGYFVLWTLTGLIVAWRRRVYAGNLVYDNARRLRVVSGVGLGLYGLSMTFAAIDWAMSLQPHWFSTIFGVMFVVGQALAALSFAVVVALALRPGDRPTIGERHDLGNLLLAFTMLWAYISFSQFLIIWYANIPEEVTFYQVRFHGGWAWTAVALVLFHFFLPFFALLPKTTKRSSQYLIRVAGLILLMRWVDLVWLIEPVRPREGTFVPWIDLAATVGLGGVWLGLFAWRYRTLNVVVLPDDAAKMEHGHG
ncbi:MAG: hypothetical protein U0836_02970 [Pirellulales bacterium]